MAFSKMIYSLFTFSKFSVYFSSAKKVSNVRILFGEPQELNSLLKVTCITFHLLKCYLNFARDVSIVQIVQVRWLDTERQEEIG